jgi:signal transduction histidine kinase
MISIHLLLHNVASVTSIIFGVGSALFVYLNNPRSRANILFSLTILAAVVFVVSHVMGVNVSDPHLSKNILMFNLSVFAIGFFNFHAILSALGKEKQYHTAIVAMYASGIFFIIYFLISQDQFLLDSVPKMYFPNYYNPGILNWTRTVFLFGISVPVTFFEFIRSYRAATSQAEKNKLKYFIMAMAVGYFLGFIPNFLVSNIMIDPLIGIWCIAFFAIPLIYGAVKYELFDIKIIAKQAFTYGIAVALIGGVLSSIEYMSQWIRDEYVDMPLWIVPLILSAIVVTVALFVWRRLRESDVLKSEFITVVTHKFRTPLTEIRWAAESLSEELPEASKDTLNQIQSANYRLIELTNLLVRLSDADTVDYAYHVHPIRLDGLMQEMFPEYERKAKLRDITFQVDGVSEKNVAVDEAQIRFVLQTLFDNAISYTVIGGSVEVHLKQDGKYISLKVTDTGIGVSREDFGRLFQKFWRSKDALKADTEGMGIGLFMSRRIIERQGGSLSAESLGAGKGTTFTLKLPIVEAAA